MTAPKIWFQFCLDSLFWQDLFGNVFRRGSTVRLFSVLFFLGWVKMSNERERQRQNVRRRPGNTQSEGDSQAGGVDPIGSASTSDQTSNLPTRSSGGSGKWVGAAAIAIAVAALGAFTLLGSGGGAGDTITDADNQSRVAAHQTLLASPGLPVKMVGADEVDDALASMPDNVSEEQREEIRQEINQGGLQLAWVTLWDTHAEDGDILRFESSTSIPIEVMALNAKTTFAIPYPSDGQVLVTGVKDGGGGITIALESGATSIAWPTMAPGDTLLLPITPGF